MGKYYYYLNFCFLFKICVFTYNLVLCQFMCVNWLMHQKNVTFTYLNLNFSFFYGTFYQTLSLENIWNRHHHNNFPRECRSIFNTKFFYCFCDLQCVWNPLTRKKPVKALEILFIFCKNQYRQNVNENFLSTFTWRNFFKDHVSKTFNFFHSNRAFKLDVPFFIIFVISWNYCSRSTFRIQKWGCRMSTITDTRDGCCINKAR